MPDEDPSCLPSAPERGVSPTDSRDQPWLGARFIALVVLAAGVELWINHHLGLSWETPWVALAFAALSGAVVTAAWLLEESGKTELAEKLRTPLCRLLNRSLLAWLWGVAVVYALFVSSLLVIPESGASGRATLRSVEGKFLGAHELKDGVARFVVFTSPFGRPYRLTVPGFLEEAVVVYPMIGLKLRPEHDLQRSPSVLFRPSPEGVRALRGQGTFTVVLDGGTGATPVILPHKAHVGSFLLGRAQPIPQANVGVWRLELEGAGASPAMIAQMVLAWSRVQVLQPLRPLAPDMTLVAEIRTPVGVVVSRARVPVGREQLTDIVLADVSGAGE